MMMGKKVLEKGSLDSGRTFEGQRSLKELKKKLLGEGLMNKQKKKLQSGQRW